MSDQTTHFTRRRGLQALAAASLTALGALSGTAALAQDGFPSKPITILVPLPLAAPPTSWRASSPRRCSRNWARP